MVFTQVKNLCTQKTWTQTQLDVIPTLFTIAPNSEETTMSFERWMGHPNNEIVQFSSVQSLSGIWLQPHESQCTRPPCPSPAPGIHSNSCPSSRWCPQSYPTLCDHMDCSPPGSSVLGTSQARILEWVVISSFTRFSEPTSPAWQTDSLSMNHLEILNNP